MDFVNILSRREFHIFDEKKKDLFGLVTIAKGI